MLFHTWTFFLFFVVVLAGYVGLRRTRFWLPWFLAASYVFYAGWSPYYLLLIVYSTALDYFVVGQMDRCRLPGGGRDAIADPDPSRGRSSRRWGGFFLGGVGVSFAVALVAARDLRPSLIAAGLVCATLAAASYLRHRKVWLGISVVNNLSLLVFFKYADFAIRNLNILLGAAGLRLELPQAETLMPFGLEYLLPVGISFYTFQSLSYTIDFYRGQIEREHSFIRFATFVAFFPQLVAGPIERAQHLLPQFARAPSIGIDDITDGLSLFLVGLFKKLALANYLSFYVQRVYEDPSQQSASSLLLGTIAFAWQIFFDFSGYSDMARGCARLMGFRLMLNFNHPYLATSLGEFWGRWHISLSTWFRDYVYIPLGGNRRGAVRTYINLALTFLISGLWHGAAWTFLIWGALHAMGTMLTRELERTRWYRVRVPRWIKQMAVFGFVCFAWIFFRAPTLGDAGTIIVRLVTAPWNDPAMPAVMLALTGVVWGYQRLYESRFRAVLEAASVRVGIATAMIIWLFLFSSGGGEFIYFQF